MTADVMPLDDYRPDPEGRLQAIVEIARSGLGHGPDRAREVLLAVAWALADLTANPEVEA